MEDVYRLPISWKKLEADSIKLVEEIKKKGPWPDTFVPIIRGGGMSFTVLTGIIERMGFEPKYCSLTAKSYKGCVQQKGIELYGMEDLAIFLKKERCRIATTVDEVRDTGRTGHLPRYILKNGIYRKDAIEKEKIEGIGKSIYHFSIKLPAGNSYIAKIPLAGDIEPQDLELLEAVLYPKPDENLTGYDPDFSVEPYYRDSQNRRVWLVFEHEKEWDELF
ncbi:MAG: hypothetical protein HYX24_06135 [Candidatus Aenigmarchaeota archaeon]|nr:hypothetical protein [Candidatus Aenigmarchaeota archaeon]